MVEIELDIDAGLSELCFGCLKTQHPEKFFVWIEYISAANYCEISASNNNSTLAISTLVKFNDAPKVADDNDPSVTSLKALTHPMGAFKPHCIEHISLSVFPVGIH